MDGLFHQGFHLFCDNFYSSPTLFNDLFEKGCFATGTVKENRVGFPSQFGNKLPKKRERGTMRWHRDGQLVFIKCKYTKDVCVLSTFHEATGTDQVKRRKKSGGKYQEMLVDIPPAIKSYNQSMGGVDLSDQLQYYAVLRKTNKWWKTLFFFHCIDVCVVDSYILSLCLEMPKRARRISARKWFLKFWNKVDKPVPLPKQLVDPTKFCSCRSLSCSNF